MWWGANEDSFPTIPPPSALGQQGLGLDGPSLEQKSYRTLISVALVINTLLVFCYALLEGSPRWSRRDSAQWGSLDGGDHARNGVSRWHRMRLAYGPAPSLRRVAT